MLTPTQTDYKDYSRLCLVKIKILWLWMMDKDLATQTTTLLRIKAINAFNF